MFHPHPRSQTHDITLMADTHPDQEDHKDKVKVKALGLHPALPMDPGMGMDNQMDMIMQDTMVHHPT
jgi:hypothetical protein